jgi:hypothetical protein
MFANITHERQNTPLPKQIWTDQAMEPYSILYNSSYLPKENLLVSGEIYRAAEICDTANRSNFRLEIKEPIITLTTGEKIVIPFKEYNYQDTLNLSTINVFDYLQTKFYYIPNNAQSVTFKVNISTTQPDTNSNGSLNTARITPFKNASFKLVAKDNSLTTLVNNIGLVSLNNSNGIFNYSKEFSINALTLRNKNVFIIPQLTVGGTYNQNNLLFSLINLSVEENSIAKDSTIITQNDLIPTEYGLEQNYPNPFNPITLIQFSTVTDEIVNLKVFDILGREVAILVNEVKSPGIYSVSFNGNNLSSGIYFYTLQTGSFNQTRKMLLLK